MTNSRKKELREMLHKVDVTELRDLLQELVEEEEEKYDNLPDSVQSSEYGERLEGNMEAMQNLIDSLDEAASYVEELDEQLGLKLWG